MAKNSSVEGSENWRPTPDNLEERENAAFHGENPTATA